MSDQIGHPRVQGYCPMGCGETLFLGSGGHVTCSWLECTNPCAVGTILSDRETEHVVELLPETFNVKHPLRERLNDALLTCDMAAYLKGLGGPPRQPGTYRVTVDPKSGDWRFTPAPRTSNGEGL